MSAPSPPPLPFLVRYALPMPYPRLTMIKAESLAQAQALAAAYVAGTLWTIASVTPYTAPS